MKYNCLLVQLNKKKRRKKKLTGKGRYASRTVISVVVGLVCRCRCRAPLLLCCPPRRSIAVDAHNPPYEQVLVGVGWWGRRQHDVAGKRGGDVLTCGSRYTGLPLPSPLPSLSLLSLPISAPPICRLSFPPCVVGLIFSLNIK